MVRVQGSKVRFAFFRPHAKCVLVLGDFNGWSGAGLAMSRCSDGYWTATVDLAPGAYRFRYQADGEWFTDYAAFGVEYGPMGINSVVRVGEAYTVDASDQGDASVQPVAAGGGPGRLGRGRQSRSERRLVGSMASGLSDGRAA